MDSGALYQEIILDHNRSPRNFGELPSPTGTASGRNPLCGDEVTVWLTTNEGQITDISFVGTGCAISKASASMMTQAIKGKSAEEAEQLFTAFHGMLTGADVDSATLGKLKVFAGVARFPSRVKCASLAWHALHDAMQRAR